MGASKANKYAVPALDKGFDILEYLSEEAVPRSQTEIANGIGRSANEIFRVLVCLEARGYLIRDELSGKYRVSLKLYTLSRTLSPIDQLRQCAIPLMEELAVCLGQSCHLSMLYQSKLIIIVQARSPAPVSLSVSEGTLFPLVPTTSGRVLLANSSATVRKMLFERDEVFLKMTKNEQKELDLDLQKILAKGYNFALSRVTEGVTDCAAIVGGEGGQVVAALAVSSLTSSLGKQIRKKELIDAVTDTARKISDLVGC